MCNWKKSIIVCENPITVEDLGDFFKSLGKISVEVGKQVAKNELKNPGRALNITTVVASAVFYRNPKAVLSSLPGLVFFYHTGKMLYLGKFV